MTTKVMQQQLQQGGKTNNNNGSFLSTNVPALEESWVHATTTRVLLRNGEVVVSITPLEEKDDDGNAIINPGVYSDQPQWRQERTCLLVKSPNRPPGSVIFQITNQGIRDVSQKEQTGTASHGFDSNGNQKRRRTMEGGVL